MKNKIKIEVYQQDWIPGFAAFKANGDIKKGINPKVVLNIGELLGLVVEKDFERKELPYIIAECLMHEVIHVLEEWAEVEFNEEKVEKLIAKYRKKYKANK